jgi:hypothetical protein
MCERDEELWLKNHDQGNPEVEPSAILNLVKPTAEGFIEHKDLLQIFIILLWYALRGS